jgi:mono/diheme cytochrome c family protein
MNLSVLMARLEAAGVKRDDVTLCSPLPLEQAPAPRSAMLPYLITILAGVVGIGVGVFFAAGTAALYPLMTGGKSIIAPPVVGIISYETMLLLAVLATFLTMIVRIVRDQGPTGTRRHSIDDGMVALIVPVGSEASEADVMRILESAGATEITVRTSGSLHRDWEPSGQALATWAMVAVLCGTLSGCSRDMQEQPSYQPQEAPRRHSPAGSVPRGSRAILSTVQRHDRSPASGQEVYRVNCLHCHGPGGIGDGVVAGYLKELPANLLSRAVQDKPQSELYDIVTHGKDMMPAFRGELSADERNAVARYVKSLPTIAATAK